MAEPKCYAQLIHLLIALLLALSLGIAALPTAGIVEANGEPTTFFTENFEGGLPGDWTVLTHQGCDWRDDDPGGRGALDGCSGTFMIADSDWCLWVAMDTELITPSIDCSAYGTVILEFDHHFHHYSEGGYEKGDVDIWDGGAWHNKAQYQSDTEGHVAIDISDVAAGKSDVKIRWHYYDAYFDWFWEVDNVELSGVPISRSLNVKYLHSEGGLFNLTDPIGTQWHELWPFFCKEYHLSSWNDTSGDGVLSYCDRIDMYQKPDGAVKPYHVEEVTITLYLRPELNELIRDGFGQIFLGEPMYIELEGGYDPAALTDPIGTQWHDVYPNFYTSYNLTAWDNTGNSTLDFCDYILLIDKESGNVTSWHVEDVAIDIVVTPEPPPVGGEAYPVDKISLLAPWIAVAVAFAGGIAWYVLRRRRT